MIIVEGVDATLKTTFENKLAERLNWKVVKGSSFELADCNNQELFDHFYNLIVGTKNVIFDRFFYSNLVYAPKFTHYALLNWGQFIYLQSLVDNKDATVVYLKGSPNVIKNRLSIRGDEYINESHIDDLCAAYDDLFHMRNGEERFVKSIEYNTDEGLDENFVDYIASLA